MYQSAPTCCGGWDYQRWVEDQLVENPSLFGVGDVENSRTPTQPTYLPTVPLPELEKGFYRS